MITAIGLQPIGVESITGAISVHLEYSIESCCGLHVDFFVMDSKPECERDLRNGLYLGSRNLNPGHHTGLPFVWRDAALSLSSHLMLDQCFVVASSDCVQHRIRNHTEVDEVEIAKIQIVGQNLLFDGMPENWQPGASQQMTYGKPVILAKYERTP